MRRRDFISALLLTPIAGKALAQHQSAAKRIALVDPAVKVTDMKIGGDSGYALFLEELQRLGYVEGKNLTIERYSAGGNKERYADLAREIVSTQPDMIVLVGSPLTLELKALTNTIPIVATTGDPIRFGLVSNLAHPGGNITGVSVDAGLALWGKRLELLAEVIPKARTVLFVSTQTAWDAAGGEATRDTAKRLGISLVLAPVRVPINEQAFRQTFEAITRDQADGIMFAAATEFYAHRLLIVTLAQRVGIPAIYDYRDEAEAGGLISYSTDGNESIRVKARQVAEVLGGRKPSEMPYVQATKYELVINLKTAKSLGLEIPATLLARADAVIE